MLQFRRATARRVVVALLAGELAQLALVVDHARRQEALLHAVLGANRAGALATLAHLSIAIKSRRRTVLKSESPECCRCTTCRPPCWAAPGTLPRCRCKTRDRCTRSRRGTAAGRSPAQSGSCCCSTGPGSGCTERLKAKRNKTILHDMFCRQQALLTRSPLAADRRRIFGSVQFAHHARVAALFFALFVVVAAVAVLAVFHDLVAAKSALPIFKKTATTLA